MKTTTHYIIGIVIVCLLIIIGLGTLYTKYLVYDLKNILKTYRIGKDAVIVMEMTAEELNSDDANRIITIPFEPGLKGVFTSLENAQKEAILMYQRKLTEEREALQACTAQLKESNKFLSSFRFKEYEDIYPPGTIVEVK